MTGSAHNAFSPLQNSDAQGSLIPLKVLIVEDAQGDAELAIEELKAAGFAPDWKRVQTEQAFIKHLQPDLDVILSDFRLPQFDGFRALAILKQRGLDIPFIIVSGAIDQDTAIASIKNGASDYLIKDRMGRLGTSVQRALQETLLRKQKQHAESGWQDSAAKYLDLFNGTPVGLCLTTEEGRFLSANPAFVKMLGYASEEELIESIADIALGLYVNQERWAEFQRLINTQGFISGFEAEFHRKDGQSIWVSESGRITGRSSGEPDSYEIFVEDITQRKATENQLHKLSRAVEQSPVSIIISDLNGTIEYVNPKCEQVSGYTAAELIGQNPRLLRGGDTDQGTYQELWEAITAGREWSGDLHNRKKSGELFWEHVAISPIRNSHGAIAHFLAIKEDITGQKLLEERLLRAQRMENIGTLAGGIAHDLNNILTPILMSIQMLREIHAEPAAANILDVIQSSAQRGADIVQQVLAFGRGMEGRQIEFQPNNIIRELVGMVNQTFPKTIQTSAFCDRSLTTVLGDPTQIHQVLLNFCVNARDAMPDGGRLEIASSNITIDENEARTLPEARPGSYVSIAVSDTGVGIPAELRAKIFDPFFTTKEIGKGTGLGLSTSFGIVKNHGGFIDVVSTPGNGSCFKVFLPAMRTSAPRQQSLDEAAIPNGNGELILIVEDEYPIRAITEDTLTTFGYRCITAPNGKEAISAYISNREEIALVLTDLMMPVMDGPTLIRSLRLLDADVKIIAVSGLLLDDRLHSEVKHFLPKPYTSPALLELIHAVLHPAAE